MKTQRKYYQQRQARGFLRIVHNFVLLIQFFSFIHESESSSGKFVTLFFLTYMFNVIYRFVTKAFSFENIFYLSSTTMS